MELPNPAPAGKHRQTAAPETSRRLAQSSNPDWAPDYRKPRDWTLDSRLARAELHDSLAMSGLGLETHTLLCVE